MPFLFLFILITSLFTRYQGNYHPFYTGLYDFIKNPKLFQNDIYFLNSFVQESSIFYGLFKYTNFSPDNDILFFGLYCFFSLIALVSIFFIIKDFLKVDNFTNILLIVLPLLVFDGGILEGPKGSILIYHTVGATPFAHFLVFPLVLFTLKRMWIATFLISTLMILLTIKVAWLPVGASILFCIYKEKKLQNLIWMLPPLLSVYLLSGNSPIPHDFNYKLNLVNIVFERDHKEDVFHLQNTYVLIFFLISFYIFYKFINKIKSQIFKEYLFLLLGLSFLVALVGGLYTAFFYKLFPDPRLVLLSPVRAMALYQFFFVLLLSYFIVSSRNLFFLRSIIISALFISGISFYGKGGLLGLLILSIAVFIYFLDRFEGNNFLMSLGISKLISLLKQSNQNFINAIFIGLLLIPIQIYSLSDFRKNVNSQTFNNLNKWTYFSNLNDPKLPDEAFKLRYCKDFKLLAINNAYGLDTYLNYLSLKSKFLGDYAHFYFDHENYIKHLNREVFFNKLKSDLFNKSIEEETLEYLDKNEIVVAGHENVLNPLKLLRPNFTLTSSIVISLPNKEKYKSLFKSCGFTINERI